MRIITETLYKFSELSESSQKKALNTHNEINIVDLDFFENNAIEKLKDIGFTDIMMRYNLGYSQGDGVCFNGGFNHDKLIEYIYTNQPIKIKRLKRILKIDGMDFSFHQRYPYYSHAHTFIIQCTTPGFNARHYITSSLLDHYINQLNTLKVDLCMCFEKEGYLEMEYQQGEDYFSELCEANNYEFYKNGELYA